VTLASAILSQYTDDRRQTDRRHIITTARLCNECNGRLKTQVKSIVVDEQVYCWQLNTQCMRCYRESYQYIGRSHHPHSLACKHRSARLRASDSVRLNHTQWDPVDSLQARPVKLHDTTTPIQTIKYFYSRLKSRKLKYCAHWYQKLQTDTGATYVLYNISVTRLLQG